MGPTENQKKQAKAQLLAGLKKPPKARVQRYLKSIEPALKEKGKSVLLFQGIACSSNMMSVLRELKALQAPNAKLLSKKNQIVAFDDEAGQQSLEFLCTKNDCALFALATHNKKRPNNLVLGRMFNHQLLDRAELGLLRFKSMHDYGGTVPKKRIGSKPLMLFVGDLWQQDLQYRNLQNLLTDFYRGDVVDKLVATGVDHIITFTIAANPLAKNGPSGIDFKPMIHQRTYFIKLKKSLDGDSKTPVPFLIPCGPDMDFTMRRNEWAAADVAAEARKQPVKKPASKKKNKTTNLFGETVGRLHIEKQKMDGRQTGRKAKALRRAEKAEKEQERAAIEAELEREKEEMGQEFKQSFGFTEEETKEKSGKKKRKSA